MPSLLLLVSLQPLEVFYYLGNSVYRHELAYTAHPYTKKESIPPFLYTRPNKGEFTNRLGIYNFAGDVEDAPGFYDYEFVGAKWTYVLQTKIDHTLLQNYVRHKFILYDAAAYLEDDESPLNQMGSIFSLENKTAVIDRMSGQNQEGEESPKVVSDASDLLKVTDFDLNTITIHTHFPKKTFIVYNDSYNSGWKLTVDGQKAELYRANVAFKGWWVDAGEHVSRLTFRPGLTVLNWILLCFTFIFFIVTLMSFRK
jgi:hypothetical protein